MSARFRHRSDLVRIDEPTFPEPIDKLSGAPLQDPDREETEWVEVRLPRTGRLAALLPLSVRETYCTALMLLLRDISWSLPTSACR